MLLAADGDKYQYHILQRGRHGILQHILEQVATILEAQVVQQGFHDIPVSRVANGLVAQALDLTTEGFSQ